MINIRQAPNWHVGWRSPGLKTVGPKKSAEDHVLWQPESMKVLIATYPSMGYFRPTQTLAVELISRGHEVAWIRGSDFESRIAKTGASFFPISPESLVDRGAPQMCRKTRS